MAKWILLSTLGWFAGQQILLHLHSLRVISCQTLEQIRVWTIPIALLMMWYAKNHVAAALICLLIIHVPSVIMMICNRRLRTVRFHRQILPFLDEVLLKMRAGRSLRESLQEVGGDLANNGSMDLRELPILLCYPERGSASSLLLEAQDLLHELEKMDRAQVRVIDRLRAFRQKEKSKQQFRQKSRQVVDQVMAQALVCGFLYTSLFLWTVLRDPTLLFSMPVLLSLSLFGAGIVALTWIGRSFRWKL